MGARGPVPKRSSERRRRNRQEPTDTLAVAGAAAERPRPNGRWHPTARRWYVSLAESGQAVFFEPSDWAGAYLVAEMMSTLSRAPRPSSQMFAALWSAMNDLLTTEGSRRRVRLEIERGAGEEKPAGVTALDDYRARLNG